MTPFLTMHTGLFTFAFSSWSQIHSAGAESLCYLHVHTLPRKTLFHISCAALHSSSHVHVRREHWEPFYDFFPRLVTLLLQIRHKNFQPSTFRFFAHQCLHTELLPLCKQVYSFLTQPALDPVDDPDPNVPPAVSTLPDPPPASGVSAPVVTQDPPASILGNSTTGFPEIDAAWTTVTGRRAARKCSAPSPEPFSSTNFWGSLQNTHRTRLNHGARRRRPRHKRLGPTPERQFVVQALADLFPEKPDLIRPEEPVSDALPSLPWTPTVDDLLHRPLS